MPSFIQPIRTYEVLFDHSRQSTGKTPAHSQTPFIYLRFDTKTAKDNLFILGFVADEQSISTGELTRIANGAYRLSARIMFSRLATYLDLLRYEKPISIRVDYEAEPATGQSVALTNFVLFTGPEPLGEGPTDQ